jgi:hypothetical protein
MSAVEGDYASVLVGSREWRGHKVEERQRKRRGGFISWSDFPKRKEKKRREIKGHVRKM